MLLVTPPFKIRIGYGLWFRTNNTCTRENDDDHRPDRWREGFYDGFRSGDVVIVFRDHNVSFFFARSDILYSRTIHTVIGFVCGVSTTGVYNGRKRECPRNRTTVGDSTRDPCKSYPSRFDGGVFFFFLKKKVNYDGVSRTVSGGWVKYK